MYCAKDSSDNNYNLLFNSKGYSYKTPSYSLELGTYYYKVLAVFGDGTESGFSDTESIEVAFLTARAPEITSLSLNNKNQPVVTWSAIPGASKYVLYRSEDKKTFSKVVTTENTEHTVITCHNGSSYYFRVQALGADGKEGKMSTYKSVTIPSKPTPPPTPKGYVGTAKGSWSGEKVYLNDSSTGIFELDEPIRNCRSLTMNLRFYNFEGHPEGMYYLYGRSESGHWNQLGEFELASNKNNTQVKQTFEFKEEKHVSITAFATALHERNRAYTGPWSFSKSMEITDVYVYE